MRKWLWWSLGLVVVIGCGFGGWFVWNKVTTAPPPKMISSEVAQLKDEVSSLEQQLKQADSLTQQLKAETKKVKALDEKRVANVQQQLKRAGNEKSSLSKQLDATKTKAKAFEDRALVAESEVANLSKVAQEVTVLKETVKKMMQQPAPPVVVVSAPPAPPAPSVVVRALPPLMPPFYLKFETLPVREIGGLEHQEEVVVVVDREDRTVGGDRVPPVEILPGRRCPALRQVTAYRGGQWKLAWVASKTALHPPQQRRLQ